MRKTIKVFANLSSGGRQEVFSAVLEDKKYFLEDQRQPILEAIKTAITFGPSPKEVQSYEVKTKGIKKGLELVWMAIGEGRAYADLPCRKMMRK